jgi:hypothetical protein
VPTPILGGHTDLHLEIHSFFDMAHLDNFVFHSDDFYNHCKYSRITVSYNFLVDNSSVAVLVVVVLLSFTPTIHC